MNYPIAHFRSGGMGCIHYDIQQGRERIERGLRIYHDDGTLEFRREVSRETAHAALREILANYRNGLKAARAKHGDDMARPLYQEARANRRSLLLRCLPKILQLAPDESGYLKVSYG